MKPIIYGLFMYLLFFWGCENSKIKPDPNKIIQKAVATHGINTYQKCEIQFNFRDGNYLIKRKNGVFQYERKRIENGDTLNDILSNTGFKRYKNNSLLELSSEDISRFSNSLNSVIYFAALPFPLTDEAVVVKYIKNTIIKNEPYHKLQVTFHQEGGGKDFEDVFIYWIHSKNFTMDYLAYEFHTDNGGIRFREAYNQRTIGGIRFQDYKNYKPKNANINLENIEDLYIKGELIEVSKIDLENVIVK